MKNAFLILLLGSVVSALPALASGQVTSDEKKLSPKQEEAAELKACLQHLAGGFLKIPDTRELRFAPDRPPPLGNEVPLAAVELQRRVRVAGDVDADGDDGGTTRRWQRAHHRVEVLRLDRAVVTAERIDERDDHGAPAQRCE